MAKVLEALERAKQERQKKLEAEQAIIRQVAENPIPSLISSESALTDPTVIPPADNDFRSSSVLPTAASPMPAEPRRPKLKSLTPTERREPLLHTQIAEQVISAHDLQSPITEQLRQIRTNLETVLAEYRSRSIVITSPISGDGKTLVTANLVTVLADNPEQQVVLVDADMRKPDIYRLFGVRQTPGLSEYLKERASLEQIIHPTSIPNLKVIPAGQSPNKPTVLLGSDRMVSMISELQRHFHWIIFDTPPLLPVTDAAVIARECIGLILVLRMGQTHRKTIERAQDLLAEMRLPVLGSILNDFVDTSPENQYYYSYYHRTTQADDGFQRG